MDLTQYARVLLAHRTLIAVAVVICTVGAVVLAWTREPTYEARTQLFVSATTAPSDRSPSESYQGGLFSQQRVTSYANIVASPLVADAVVRRRGVPRSPGQVQSAIRASVPENTVLIDVAVTDRSPQVAKDIADGVGAEFPRFVDELESSPTKESPVKVSVTSPASLPASPVRPKKPLYVTLGILLGLALGVGVAVMREVFDRRIRTEAEATGIARAPVLGRILDDKGAQDRPLVVVAAPTSPEAEAYRQLRTNLGVLSSDQDIRTFVISSADDSEGKTLIAANLGLAMAEAGVHVVLVDADMRRPRLAELLGFRATVGLSDVLMGDVPVEAALQRHHMLPLEVLSSGATRSNPSELLGSEACSELLHSLSDRAGIVIVDTPALLAVSDAAVLARLASAVVLVARVGSTRAQQFDAAAESIRSVGKHTVGVVLNGVPAGRRRGYYESTQAAPESPSYEGAVSEG